MLNVLLSNLFLQTPLPVQKFQWQLDIPLQSLVMARVIQFQKSVSDFSVSKTSYQLVVVFDTIHLVKSMYVLASRFTFGLQSVM